MIAKSSLTSELDCHMQQALDSNLMWVTATGSRRHPDIAFTNLMVVRALAGRATQSAASASISLGIMHRPLIRTQTRNFPEHAKGHGQDRQDRPADVSTLGASAHCTEYPNASASTNTNTSTTASSLTAFASFTASIIGDVGTGVKADDSSGSPQTQFRRESTSGTGLHPAHRDSSSKEWTAAEERVLSGLIVQYPALSKTSDTATEASTQASLPVRYISAPRNSATASKPRPVGHPSSSRWATGRQGELPAAASATQTGASKWCEAGAPNARGSPPVKP